MYAAPPDSVGVVPARRGFTQGPILAVCCLGIILFLIAATIVLALIPLYIPKKTVTTAATSSPRTFKLTPNSVASSGKRQASNSIGNDGSLDSTATLIIANAIATNIGLPSGSLSPVGTGTVATTSSKKRKRRSFGLSRSERSSGVQRIYITAVFVTSKCGACRVTVTTVSLSVTFSYGGRTITVGFTVAIVTTVISIPATLASSTTTTISSNTTTIATNTTAATATANFGGSG